MEPIERAQQIAIENNLRATIDTLKELIKNLEKDENPAMGVSDVGAPYWETEDMIRFCKQNVTKLDSIAVTSIARLAGIRTRVRKLQVRGEITIEQMNILLTGNIEGIENK